MRSASDFDSYYQSRDPWQITRAHRRDQALLRVIGRYVTDKTVLELGSGEGHLTASVFRQAKMVKGVDISAIAVSRAQALRLANASFEASDFLNVSFIGYDVVAAIECIYYLSPSEQEAFFRKLADESSGKILIISGPIIGANEYRTYFTDHGLREIFARYGMQVVESQNLNAYRKAGIGATMAAAATRFPYGKAILPWLPQRWVYQRCYAVRLS